MLRKKIETFFEIHSRKLIGGASLVGLAAGPFNAWALVAAFLCSLWMVFDERRGHPKGHIVFGTLFGVFLGALTTHPLAIALGGFFGMASGVSWQADEDMRSELCRLQNKEALENNKQYLNRE